MPWLVRIPAKEMIQVTYVLSVMSESYRGLPDRKYLLWVEGPTSSKRSTYTMWFWEMPRRTLNISSRVWVLGLKSGDSGPLYIVRVLSWETAGRAIWAKLCHHRSILPFQ